MPEPMVVQTEEHLINRWWQLMACVVAMMAIANLQYAWTLFTLPLTQRLHATLSAVQLGFTLFILAETWLVPVEGYLVDRLGAWRVVTAGGLLVGVSWVGSGLAASRVGERPRDDPAADVPVGRQRYALADGADRHLLADVPADDPSGLWGAHGDRATQAD